MSSRMVVWANNLSHKGNIQAELMADAANYAPVMLYEAAAAEAVLNKPWSQVVGHL